MAEAIRLDDKSSETLAAIVLAFRVLGINRDDAAKAMQILSQRRADGEEFDYEQFIKDHMEKVPKVNHQQTFQTIKQIFAGLKVPRG
jgi:hypothetical protein